jgi:hypothetical protein
MAPASWGMPPREEGGGDVNEAAPFPRAFTVEEANALVPELESVFAALDEHQATLKERLDRIQILDVLWGRGLADPANPDRAEFLSERAAVREALHRIDALVSTRLSPLGVRVPSGGLEQGLVDFPTTLEGRWVLLCWRRGEREVGAWHELGGGYAGRRPLTRYEEARMGVPGPAGWDEASTDPGDHPGGTPEAGPDD